MIKGQHECLGEALFYINICLSNDSFEINLIVIFKCSKESTLQTFHLPCNLEFNVLFKDVLTRVHSLCNAKDFKA